MCINTHERGQIYKVWHSFWWCDSAKQQQRLSTTSVIYTLFWWFLTCKVNSAIFLYIILPDFPFSGIYREGQLITPRNVFNQEALQIKTLLTFSKIIWKRFCIIGLDYFILAFLFTSNYKWHFAVSERPLKLKSNIWRILPLFMQMILKHRTIIYLHCFQKTF